MTKLIQHNMRDHAERVIKEIPSRRIAEYLAKRWNKSADKFNAPVFYMIGA